jgi:hypothetical protein
VIRAERRLLSSFAATRSSATVWLTLPCIAVRPNLLCCEGTPANVSSR